MEVTWRTFLHSSEETLHLIVGPEEDPRSVSKIRGDTMLEIDAEVLERISCRIHTRTIGSQRKDRGTETLPAGEAVRATMLPLSGADCPDWLQEL
jgi:hypothetical protein